MWILLFLLAFSFRGLLRGIFVLALLSVGVALYVHNGVEARRDRESLVAAISAQPEHTTVAVVRQMGR